MDFKGRFCDSYYYNDLMYGIIVKLIEDISGSQWEILVIVEIFNWFGMIFSSFFIFLVFNLFL